MMEFFTYTHVRSHNQCTTILNAINLFSTIVKIKKVKVKSVDMVDLSQIADIVHPFVFLMIMILCQKIN